MSNRSIYEPMQQSLRQHEESQGYQVNLKLADDVYLPGFHIAKGVFQADRMTSLPFAQFLLERRSTFVGRDVADIMCGSGLLGIAILMGGARRVTFSDLSSAAVSCTQQNLQHYWLKNRATVIQADLFDHPNYQPVDVMVCNPPYFVEGAEHNTDLARVFFAPPDLHERFLREAYEHLKPSGLLYMPFREAAGAHNDPGVQAPKYGFTVASVEERPSTFGVAIGGPIRFYMLQR